MDGVWFLVNQQWQKGMAFNGGLMGFSYIDFPKKNGGLNLLQFWAFNMFQNVSKSSEQSGCALPEVIAKVAEGIRHFLKYTLW